MLFSSLKKTANRFRKSGEETYIYDANYEMKKLTALLSTRAERDIVYVINPAFWRGLDIDQK
jgi:hypothetical protein